MNKINLAYLSYIFYAVVILTALKFIHVPSLYKISVIGLYGIQLIAIVGAMLILLFMFLFKNASKITVKKIETVQKNTIANTNKKYNPVFLIMDVTFILVCIVTNQDREILLALIVLRWILMTILNFYGKSFQAWANEVMKNGKA